MQGRAKRQDRKSPVDLPAIEKARQLSYRANSRK